MAELKAGHVASIGNSMAEAIEQAMQEEYLIVTGTPLPFVGQEDRRLLFVAIARGVLQYLKAHEGEMFNSITLDSTVLSATTPVKKVEVNYSGA